MFLRYHDEMVCHQYVKNAPEMEKRFPIYSLDRFGANSP